MCGSARIMSRVDVEHLRGDAGEDWAQYLLTRSGVLLCLDFGEVLLGRQVDEVLDLRDADAGFVAIETA